MSTEDIYQLSPRERSDQHRRTTHRGTTPRCRCGRLSRPSSIWRPSIRVIRWTMKPGWCSRWAWRIITSRWSGSSHRPATLRRLKRSCTQLPASKTLIHCAANFRVTAFYSLYAMKHLGWSEAQAAEFRASVWADERLSDLGEVHRRDASEYQAGGSNTMIDLTSKLGRKVSSTCARSMSFGSPRSAPIFRLNPAPCGLSGTVVPSSFLASRRRTKCDTSWHIRRCRSISTPIKRRRECDYFRWHRGDRSPRGQLRERYQPTCGNIAPALRRWA